MASNLDSVRTLLFATACAVSGLTGCEAGSGPAPDTAADKSGLVGNPAPDFEVQPVAGAKGTISLKSLRGQVVLVDFWGTFCEPCKKSFPKLEALSKKYAGSLRIVGISEDEEDDKDKIPAFAQTYGAKFAVAWDADKSIARQYKPETMPSSFIIDKDGVIRYAHVGFHDGEEVQVDQEIRQLLSR
jgi:peroxiredoxin